MEKPGTLRKHWKEIKTREWVTEKSHYGSDTYTVAWRITWN